MVSYSKREKKRDSPPPHHITPPRSLSFFFSFTDSFPFLVPSSFFEHTTLPRHASSSIVVRNRHIVSSPTNEHTTIINAISQSETAPNTTLFECRCDTGV
mmetsp:Transcript_16035/g.17303  ORF Transcript_16035/g.17303 Transcript_16035/m.17303 type:complete len:100 (+) Transcript_16035:127-426(+)